MRGKVQKFNPKRGYGFISTEGVNEDIFVHYSAITDMPGYRMLRIGELVEFELHETEKGLLARNVRLADVR